MLEHPYKAVFFGVLIWITGFVWGSIVFMTPALNGFPPIPYISRNPAISFPILVFWIPLTWFLARNYLKTVWNKPGEGVGLGMTFAGLNFLLDLLILVGILKTGRDYFASLTVWTAYALLLVIPMIVARLKQ